MHDRLRHRLYAIMADFRRHVNLLEQNALTFNGDLNKSITAAAIKVRSDIYHQMDEIPAEPPVDDEVTTQVRQAIFVDDDGSVSAANSDTNGNAASDEIEEASRKKAAGSEPEARGTNGCTFMLPLGRLCVSHNAGGIGVIVTPYIIVVNLKSAFKALWLIKNNYTPIRLPNNKKTLLDFRGRYNFTIRKLADDIED